MQDILMSLLIGFGASAAVAPFVIKLFARLKNGQPILHYVEMHQTKAGTPTMGGVIFIFGTILSFLFLLGQNVRLASIVMASMIGYGLLGFLDDFIKVKLKNNQGLRAYQKMIGQLGIAILVAVFVYNSGFVGSEVAIPFTDIFVNFGWLIIPFVVFVYLAVTNAVNLTDGVDGLATGVSLTYLAGFGIALYMYITRMADMGVAPNMITEYTNILILCAGLFGALLAFMCFNSHKASIFMGDVGSLAIGAFIASATVLTRMYLFFPFFGIMFVITTISVVLQVGYYKLKKKRIFLMAPLHHHFEKKGWHENKIVAIYIVITILASAGTLMFI